MKDTEDMTGLLRLHRQACTREMVGRRMVELAAQEGRNSNQITRVDRAWAKYEITGESIPVKQRLILARGWR